MAEAFPKHCIELADDLGSLALLAGFLEEKGLDLGLPEDVRRALDLASDEAVTNIISYAYQGREPGPIRVLLQRLPDRAVLTIEDEGNEFDPGAVEEPDLDAPLEERHIGGLGLFFIHEMTDEVRRERVDGVNRLIMVKLLPQTND